MKFLKWLNPFRKYQEIIADYRWHNQRLREVNASLENRLQVQEAQSEQMRQEALREIEAVKQAGDMLKVLLDGRNKEIARLRRLNEMWFNVAVGFKPDEFIPITTPFIENEISRRLKENEAD